MNKRLFTMTIRYFSCLVRLVCKHLPFLLQVQFRPIPSWIQTGPYCRRSMAGLGRGPVRSTGRPARGGVGKRTRYSQKKRS